jgi:hypothetical protein
VHVVPVGDLIEHVDRWDCLCGPDGEFFAESGRWCYVHHSLDGREFREGVSVLQRRVDQIVAACQLRARRVRRMLTAWRV